MTNGLEMPHVLIELTFGLTIVLALAATLIAFIADRLDVRIGAAATAVYFVAVIGSLLSGGL